MMPLKPSPNTATGILFNLALLALIGILVWRQRLRTSLAAYAAE
jgi:hypothetical protein